MSLDIGRIKALCFDVDGTLSDTDDLWVNRLGGILRPLRWLLPRKDELYTARFWVMAAETPSNLAYMLADRLRLDDDVVRVLRRFSSRERNQLAKHWIIPGVIECLTRLGKVYPMSIVSARDEHSTLVFLDQFGLIPMFQTIVTSQTCEYTKPFPEPVLWAAKQMAIPPENCLMIGDTTVDITSGERAGAQTLGVLCGFGHENELRKAGADAILETTSNLSYVLLNPEKPAE